jgi:hypothetical protein
LALCPSGANFGHYCTIATAAITTTTPTATITTTTVPTTFTAP